MQLRTELNKQSMSLNKIVIGFRCYVGPTNASNSLYSMQKKFCNDLYLNIILQNNDWLDKEIIENRVINKMDDLYLYVCL